MPIKDEALVTSDDAVAQCFAERRGSRRVMGAVQDHRRRFLDLFQPPGETSLHAPRDGAFVDPERLVLCAKRVNRSAASIIRRLCAPRMPGSSSLRDRSGVRTRNRPPLTGLTDNSAGTLGLP